MWPIGLGRSTCPLAGFVAHGRPAGKGSSLARPPLPIDPLPVRVQLVSGTGACWETALGSVRRNTDVTFLARE